jgi:hypothetical protein
MDECGEWGFGYTKYLAALPTAALGKSLPCLIANPQLAAMLAKPTARLLHRIQVDLRDPQAKWFVAGNAEIAPSIAEDLMRPFLDAAIDEINPSGNRVFVDPCMSVFGPRPVNEYLLSVAESGTDSRIAGALKAGYWAQWSSSNAEATQESRAAQEALPDAWHRWANLALETFVANTDVNVRRCAIAKIDVDAGRYDSAHRELLAQAIAIASNHPDDFIRRRVDVQLASLSLRRNARPH